MQNQKGHSGFEHELEILGGEAITAKERPSVGRVTFAAAIGATVEWYDFFLYGLVAALIFNKQYVPSNDPLVGTMLAYGTFAVGFLARPIGGVVFGHFGDRVGRKSMLVLTLMIMGAATVIIGLVVLITRRKAVTQVVGYLVLENGIYVFGLSQVERVPFLVEAGVLLDIFVGVFIMGIVVFHINREFDSIDSARLTELRD